VIVVSDTSPISTLLTVGSLSLLHQLYGEILVPNAVWLELQEYHPEVRYHPFLKQCLIGNRQAVDKLLETLDAGEAEAIVLAIEHNADILLIDESLGRKYATIRSVPVIGLMGVFLMAKSKGLIQAVAPLIEDVEKKAGFYLSRSLKLQILKDAGEC
jgi:predicted nucleic acid-binding protein